MSAKDNWKSEDSDSDYNPLPQDDPDFEVSKPEFVGIEDSSRKSDVSWGKWDDKSTMCLIRAYVDRIERFRAKDEKKKHIWADITRVMQKAGYSDINQAAADRKMRNLKKTYKAIKEKLRETGGDPASATWRYFRILDGVLSDEFEKVYNKTTNHNEKSEPPEKKIKIEIIPVADSDHEREPDSPKPTPKSTKPTDSEKLVQRMRRKQLMLEERKVKAMEEMHAQLVVTNRHLKERNELLKKLVNRLFP